MAVYVELFHGRFTPDEDMDGWGFQGPVFGPVPYCHITYGSDIKIGEEYDDLTIDKNGLVEFEGAFYGDFSVFSTLDTTNKKRLKATQKTLASTSKDWPLIVTDEKEEPWIKLYAERKLKGASNEPTTESGTPDQPPRRTSRRRRKSS